MSKDGLPMLKSDELLRQISLWAAFSMPMTSEQIRSLADYLEPTISAQITTLLDNLEQSIKQHTVPEGSHYLHNARPNQGGEVMENLFPKDRETILLDLRDWIHALSTEAKARLEVIATNRVPVERSDSLDTMFDNNKYNLGYRRAIVDIKRLLEEEK